MRPYLNIGCGITFHESWENIDIVSHSPFVRRHDLADGLPYADNSFDAVYASHLLEHIPFSLVDGFIAECVRVARPGAIIRLVVPDLENMARVYLETVDKAASGELDALLRHDWMIIEMIDQSVRTASGGRMKQFLQEHQGDPVLRFVQERIGREACVQERPRSSGAIGLATYYRFAARKLVELVAQVLLGRKGRAAVEEGFLRASGEVHRWMYDAVSLHLLLERHGCTHVRRVDARTSSIPGFAAYQLDTEGQGTRKPDSLFLEAQKSGERWESAR